MGKHLKRTPILATIALILALLLTACAGSQSTTSTIKPDATQPPVQATTPPANTGGAQPTTVAAAPAATQTPWIIRETAVPPANTGGGAVATTVAPAKVDPTKPAAKTLPKGVTDLGGGVGCVDPLVIAEILNRTHPTGDPGLAALEFDKLFDQSAQAGVFIGQHAVDVGYVFRPSPKEGGNGSAVYWHNALKGAPVQLDQGQNKVMNDLFLQGTYGVRGIWDTRVRLVENDGRSAWTCSYLNPEKMLDYWGK